MSRDSWDQHDEARGQPELKFIGIGPEPDEGEERAAATGPSRAAARPERNGDPARSAFFRARRRPVLPVLGVVGAVATVSLFLWLGSDDEPAPEAPALEELAPVASAPEFELPFPEAADGPPAARSLAVPPLADPTLAVPPPADPTLAAPPPAVPTLAAPEPVAPPAQVAAIAESAPAAAPKPAPVARDAFAVQLLAARSEADVGASWATLSQAHPDLLASLSPTVARLDRGPGDTFYRLRAGPLRDRGAAEALCKALSARQQSCFVVSPGS